MLNVKSQRARFLSWDLKCDLIISGVFRRDKLLMTHISWQFSMKSLFWFSENLPPMWFQPTQTWGRPPDSLCIKARMGHAVFGPYMAWHRPLLRVKLGHVAGELLNEEWACRFFQHKAPRVLEPIGVLAWFQAPFAGHLYVFTSWQSVSCILICDMKPWRRGPPRTSEVEIWEGNMSACFMAGFWVSHHLFFYLSVT